jgi:hypothetical protein
MEITIRFNTANIDSVAMGGLLIRHFKGIVNCNYGAGKEDCQFLSCLPLHQDPSILAIEMEYVKLPIISFAKDENSKTSTLKLDSEVLEQFEEEVFAMERKYFPKNSLWKEMKTTLNAMFGFHLLMGRNGIISPGYDLKPGFYSYYELNSNKLLRWYYLNDLVDNLDILIEFMPRLKDTEGLVGKKLLNEFDVKMAGRGVYKTCGLPRKLSFLKAIGKLKKRLKSFTLKK